MRFPPLSDEQAESLLVDVRRVLPAEADALSYYPTELRAAGLALMGLGAELLAIPHKAQEPGLRAIRYQWWRDAVEEAAGPDRRPRAHPVAQGLALTLPAKADPEELIRALNELIDAAEGAAGTHLADKGGVKVSATPLRAALTITIITTILGSTEQHAPTMAEVTAAATSKEGWSALTPLPPAIAPVLAPLKPGTDTNSVLARRASLFLTVLRGK